MKYNNMIDYAPQTTYKYSEQSNWYIEYKALDGSYHRSAYTKYEDAIAEMPKYVNIAQHFGGGLVKLMELPNHCIRFKNVQVDND